MGRLEAKSEAPTGENGETLWEKNSVPTERRGHTGKMSSVTRK
jgi:hypothetical protein